LTKELKQRIDWLQCKAKNALKQRRDIPFEERIETTNRLPSIDGQTIVETTVRFSI